MKLVINGDLKVIETNSKVTSLESLIKSLGHHPQSIVIEFNGVIINRKKWSDQIVKEGDQIEIVTIVGGGS